MRVPTLIYSRSKSSLFASKFLLAKNYVSIESVLCPSPQVTSSYGGRCGGARNSLGRRRSSLLGLKRFKDDNEKADKFVKTRVLRLLKMDMIAVLNELEHQEEVHLAAKMFNVIKKQYWCKPDVFLYKDLIVALARRKNMDDVELRESMKKENLFPYSQTCSEVIRGFLQYGSPADAMYIYEDMKKSRDLSEQLPFKVLLKWFLPHPLLSNRVKQDFEEIFPDQHVYDPPQEIFGLQ